MHKSLDEFEFWPDLRITELAALERLKNRFVTPFSLLLLIRSILNL